MTQTNLSNFGYEEFKTWVQDTLDSMTSIANKSRFLNSMNERLTSELAHAHNVHRSRLRDMLSHIVAQNHSLNRR